MIMPLIWTDPANEYAVMLAAIPWCIAESVRYPYYQFPSLKYSVVGHLRYNLFIVLYPCGVTGELLCFYLQWCKSRELPDAEKPWCLQMPNQWNIGVNFEALVAFGIPIIYALQFPPLYTYLLGQRKKFYEEIKSLKSKKAN